MGGIFGTSSSRIVLYWRRTGEMLLKQKTKAQMIYGNLNKLTERKKHLEGTRRLQNYGKQHGPAVYYMKIISLMADRECLKLNMNPEN